MEQNPPRWATQSSGIKDFPRPTIDDCQRDSILSSRAMKKRGNRHSLKTCTRRARENQFHSVFMVQKLHSIAVDVRCLLCQLLLLLLGSFASLLTQDSFALANTNSGKQCLLVVMPPWQFVSLSFLLDITLTRLGHHCHCCFSSRCSQQRSPRTMRRKRNCFSLAHSQRRLLNV